MEGNAGVEYQVLGVRGQVSGGGKLLIINCKLKKYLLENYPLIWNTKLLPMLGLAACGHVFFFLLGYIVDKGSIYERVYTIGEEFFPLPFLLHLIVSILLL